MFYGFGVTAQVINPVQVLKDVEILSSDVYEGRQTGTKENQMAADYIIGRLTKLGVAPYQKDFKHPFTFKTRQGEDVKGVNVLGIIPGKTAGLIVISAHYDHVGIKRGLIYNGADDNASGVGGLLAAAEFFTNNKPEKTIIIAAFDAEEMGLQGAKAFVADPTTELSKILLNINMDMISHNDKNELYVAGSFANPALKPFLVSNNPKVKLIAGHDDPKLGHDDWTNQSDQGAFNAKKIPFLYFGVEDHPDYHKATDEYSTITKDFYVNAVEVIIRIAGNYDKSTAKKSKSKLIMKN
ncbi:M28 family peptidase [Pedobacter sp. HMF7056]|uniref:M28 family peptidase n=2 Tax=Hufsiella ginkgonis TaxID=2695274 RepID=A0A7K1XZR1_9SPHI|nr:M28 family peptidase [Hufsiella ginkgonis]